MISFCSNFRNLNSHSMVLESRAY
uniref:Uncharacterized protein n=1 Tax=Rhizophora mucronata TaxID=61149 RepID=A0A2P2R440_RHIMU